MKKKWVFIVIGLLLVAGIGGKMYMDKREEQKEAEKIEAERMSVVALKNTFAGIKSVEIEHADYNVMTGIYDFYVKMTNINGESVRFDYSFATNNPNEIGSFGVVDKEKVQIKGKTKTKVKVIYTNGNKEEV